MKKRIICSAFILLFCLVVGCSSQEKPLNEGVSGIQNSAPDGELNKPVGERISEFQRLAPDGTLASFVPVGAFTASDRGDIFLSENFERISQYTMDGTLVKSYENGKSAMALCLMGDDLFFYTAEGELKRLSLGDGTVKTVTGKMQAPYLYNLTTAGGKLYALMDEDDRKLIKEIDPETGSIETVEVENDSVRAVYASTDGKLYYCLDIGGECFLYSYQPENWRRTMEYNLTNQLSPGTAVNCFTYEQGLFAYASADKEIHILSLKDENSTETVLGGDVIMGRDMVCASGNLICRVYTEEKTLYSLYLGEVKFPETPREGTVSVRVFSDGLATKGIESSSGIRTKRIKGDVFTDEFLAEVMAGNPEVDIYLLPIGSLIAQRMKEQGIFEPLTSSAKSGNIRIPVFLTSQVRWRQERESSGCCQSE